MQTYVHIPLVSIPCADNVRQDKKRPRCETIPITVDQIASSVALIKRQNAQPIRVPNGFSLVETRSGVIGVTRRTDAQQREIMLSESKSLRLAPLPADQSPIAGNQNMSIKETSQECLRRMIAQQKKHDMQADCNVIVSLKRRFGSISDGRILSRSKIEEQKAILTADTRSPLDRFSFCCGPPGAPQHHKYQSLTLIISQLHAWYIYAVEGICAKADNEELKQAMFTLWPTDHRSTLPFINFGALSFLRRKQSVTLGLQLFQVLTQLQAVMHQLRIRTIMALWERAGLMFLLAAQFHSAPTGALASTIISDRIELVIADYYQELGGGDGFSFLLETASCAGLLACHGRPDVPLTKAHLLEASLLSQSLLQNAQNASSAMPVIPFLLYALVDQPISSTLEKLAACFCVELKEHMHRVSIEPWPNGVMHSPPPDILLDSKDRNHGDKKNKFNDNAESLMHTRTKGWIETCKNRAELLLKSFFVRVTHAHISTNGVSLFSSSTPRGGTSISHAGVSLGRHSHGFNQSLGGTTQERSVLNTESTFPPEFQFSSSLPHTAIRINSAAIRAVARLLLHLNRLPTTPELWEFLAPWKQKLTWL